MHLSANLFVSSLHPCPRRPSRLCPVPACPSRQSDQLPQRGVHWLVEHLNGGLEFMEFAKEDRCLEARRPSESCLEVIWSLDHWIFFGVDQAASVSHSFPPSQSWTNGTLSTTAEEIPNKTDRDNGLPPVNSLRCDAEKRQGAKFWEVLGRSEIVFNLLRIWEVYSVYCIVISVISLSL